MMRVEMGASNDLLIWKLQDKLSIEEAVALMFGIVPEGENRNFLTYANKDRWPIGFLPLVRLITNAIESEKVEGNIVTYHNDSDVDLSASLVDVASLSGFLKSKHVVDHFFNDTVTPKAEYLDPQHPCYAPKLAAAVMAWQETALMPLTGKEKGTPKQRIEIWLRQHAGKFGLTKDDGNFNQVGIEEIAKVANWQPQGGAAQTPGAKIDASVESDLSIHIPRIELTRPPMGKPKKINEEAPFDDEIPF